VRTNTAAAFADQVLKCWGESVFACVALLELMLCEESEGLEGGWQKAMGGEELKGCLISEGRWAS